MKKTNKINALSLLGSLSLVLISACGGGSNDSSAQQAPTAITISSNSVDENASGEVIGTLSATDVNTDDTFTFTTSHDDFEITADNQLKLKAEQSLNYEIASSVDVSVTVTDSSELTFQQDLTINVNDLLDTYKFENADGDSTVSYSGQVARMTLISELNQYIGSGLQVDLDSEALATREAVLNKLNSFYEISEQAYEEMADSFVVDFIDMPEQTTLRAVSSSQKDLLGKIAGSDEVGQHKDWNEGDFEGWGSKGSTTPHGLVQIYFGLLADHAQEFIDGNLRREFGDDAGEIIPIYVTEDGRDLKQLIQKFLLGAIAFSQGADDYLDNDTDGKGLLSTNIPDDSAYSSLGHAWDEGFGYFGAARDYLEYTDDEIASKGGREDYQGKHDTNGDTLFDLFSEINLGNSVNAAKRDRGSSTGIDLSTQAFQGFLQGRKIINDNLGTELTDQQRTDLFAQRDSVLDAWEKSISATVIHYINDTRADLERLRTDDVEFSYTDLAKHWSEMKGFALNLQFNRLSLLSDEDYTELHDLMGDTPVLSEANIAEYRDDLLAARALLQAAYSFAAEDVENW